MADVAINPGLQGLLDLAQWDGVDVRPTMLRVLTDLYVQTPLHAPDDERQYVELALRLIDAVDVPARVVLAKRLAGYAAAPRAVVLRLAREVVEVAEPILRRSPVLTPADLAAIAAECGAGHAAAIAQRGTEAADEDADAAGRTPPANAEALDLCELFFAAGGPERRLILLNLDYLPGEPSRPPTPLQRADLWRLESAALKHQTDTVVRELERALGVSSRIARRIVGDELGEPVVVAAKAMKLPADVLQRMLLFMNPRVGQSVDRVYELSNLYREASVEAARRLIAIMRNADPAGRRSARHDSLHWREAAETAQRALSEIARPSDQRRDTLHLQRTGSSHRTRGR